MENDSTKPLGKVIRIDESEIRGQQDEMVRGTVEGTLNALLEGGFPYVYLNGLVLKRSEYREIRHRRWLTLRGYDQVPAVVT